MAKPCRRIYNQPFDKIRKKYILYMNLVRIFLRGSKVIWFMNLIIIWLALDLIILATIWYGYNTLRIYFPRWWKRSICDELPYFDR